jgi:aldose sugar dehydrogenase
MNQTRLLLRGTAVGLLTTAMALSAAAEETFSTDHYEVQIERLASVEHPWGLAFLPDGRYLVTERNAGTIRIGDRDGNLSPPISGTPEVFRYAGPTDRSQGGMFHVALHPDFAENGYVYWSFSEPSDEGAGTAIARGILVGEGDAPAFEGVEVIYTMNKHDSSGLHFGGRFAFHPEDNSIYLSVGERRNISRAQDGEDHAGSIIRVMDDGSTPDDNPHLDDDAVDDLIYAIGIRNIQALAFHPETNDLWAADHGPRAATRSTGSRPARTMAGLSRPAASTTPALRSARARKSRAWSLRSTSSRRRSPPPASSSTTARCSPSGRATC